MYIQTVFIAVLVVMCYRISQVLSCPAECTCGLTEISANDSLATTDCSNSRLTSVPAGIPDLTQILNLSYNQLRIIQQNDISHLFKLQFLDTRWNPSLRYLPQLTNHSGQLVMLTDNGYTCCLFEVERQQSNGNTRGSVTCDATEAYTECSADLIPMSTIIIYIIVVPIATIMNIWVSHVQSLYQQIQHTCLSSQTVTTLCNHPISNKVIILSVCSTTKNKFCGNNLTNIQGRMREKQESFGQVLIVTLAYRPRRVDPIMVNAVNFVVAHFMMLVYAGVILGHGIEYLGCYPLYTERWLESPLCGFVGFMLITATIVIWFSYSLDGLCIYLKLKYPLHITCHMTRKRHAIATVILWCTALLIAMIPFMVSGRYNRVGLCLPFYSGDFDAGFKFVIFYTCLGSLLLIVMSILMLRVVHSIIHSRPKVMGASAQATIDEENHTVQKNVTESLLFFILTWIVMVVFLIMSCIGGSTGQEGREWFARLCVVQTVIYPATGMLRKKQFHRDTKRVMERINFPCKDQRKKLAASHKRVHAITSDGHSTSAQSEISSQNRCSQCSDEVILCTRM